MTAVAPPAAPPAPAPTPRRRRVGAWIAIGVALLVVGGIGGAISAANQWATRDRRSARGRPQISRATTMTTITTTAATTARIGAQPPDSWVPNRLARKSPIARAIRSSGVGWAAV